MITRLLLFAIALTVSPWAAAAESVAVLGLFSGKAVLQIDGHRRVLADGERSPEGVRLIHADSDSALLEVNGKSARYTLNDQIGSSFKSPVSKEVRIAPGLSGMYNVAGAINGYSIDFMVDTGATLVSMNATQARRLGIDFRKEGRPMMVETASGREIAYRVMLDRVSVGAIQLYNVPATVLNGKRPSQVLLGMSFLSRLDMKREGQVLVLSSKY